jgi:hypothetical protein
MLKKHLADGLEYTEISPEILKAIKQLWKDKGVQECFRRRDEFQLVDSAQ